MSGGHWNYSQYKIEEMLGDVGGYGQVILSYPKTAAAFRRLSQVLGGIEHDLDWWLSGDSGQLTKTDEDMVLDILLAVIGGTDGINTRGERP